VDGLLTPPPLPRSMNLGLRPLAFGDIRGKTLKIGKV